MMMISCCPTLAGPASLITAVETTTTYLHELMMVFILSDMEQKMSEKIRSADVAVVPVGAGYVGGGC